jgi:hypothetical protein
MPRYGLVEFWRPRPEWYAMSRKEKEEFVEGIRENVASLEKRGAKLLVCTCAAGPPIGTGWRFGTAPT